MFDSNSIEVVMFLIVLAGTIYLFLKGPPKRKEAHTTYEIARAGNAKDVFTIAKLSKGMYLFGAMVRSGRFAYEGVDIRVSKDTLREISESLKHFHEGKFGTMGTISRRYAKLENSEQVIELSVNSWFLIFGANISVKLTRAQAKGLAEKIYRFVQ